MSNELESDSAMAMNLESFGVDGAGYDETETAVNLAMRQVLAQPPAQRHR